jgi:multidrug resistance efflux pump
VRLLEKGASTQEAADRAKRQAEGDAASAEAAGERADLVARGTRVEDRDLASADVEAARAALAEAEAALSRREIRAPRGGAVLDVLFEPGEYYSPGGGALLVLGDLSRIEVALEVDELDVPRVSLGQRVVITADGFAKPVAEGRIVAMNPRMGKKGLATERAQDKSDTRIREVTVELDGAPVVSGQRVWATIAAAPAGIAAAE